MFPRCSIADKQPKGCDAQLTGTQRGKRNPEMPGRNVRRACPDPHAGLYKSLRVATMIGGTMVNTQTHRETAFHWLYYWVAERFTNHCSLANSVIVDLRRTKCYLVSLLCFALCDWWPLNGNAVRLNRENAAWRHRARVWRHHAAACDRLVLLMRPPASWLIVADHSFVVLRSGSPRRRRIYQLNGADRWGRGVVCCRWWSWRGAPSPHPRRCTCCDNHRRFNPLQMNAHTKRPFSKHVSYFFCFFPYVLYEYEFHNK